MYLRAYRLLEGLTPDAALKRRTSRTSPFLDFFSSLFSRADKALLVLPEPAAQLRVRTRICSCR